MDTDIHSLAYMHRQTDRPRLQFEKVEDCVCNVCASCYADGTVCSTKWIRRFTKASVNFSGLSRWAASRNVEGVSQPDATAFIA